MSHLNNENKSSSSLTITDKVLRTFEPVKTFNYHQGASITSLDFDDTGQYLISSGIDKSIQLYDVHKGIHHKDIQSQKYGAHLARFTHLELNCLYASTPAADLKIDNAIRYLSLSNNQYLRYFKGHKEQVTAIDVNPVEDIFISSSLDRTVKLWDLRSTLPVGNLDVGRPSVVAFDPKGIIFAVGKYPSPAQRTSNTGTIAFYDINNFDKKPFLVAEIPILPGQIWNKLEFSNNGKLLLVSTDSYDHYVVDTFLGQLLTTLLLGPLATQNEYNGDWMTFKYPYTGSTSFTPCGKFVVVGSPKLTVLAFDLTTLKNSEGGSHPISELDNPRKLRPFKALPTNQGIPKIIAFNQKLLTFATADNTVSLWQAKLPDSI